MNWQKRYILEEGYEGTFTREPVYCSCFQRAKDRAWMGILKVTKSHNFATWRKKKNGKSTTTANKVGKSDWLSVCGMWGRGKVTGRETGEPNSENQKSKWYR